MRHCTKLSESLILTDCDGVLLDWTSAFATWMAKFGHSVKNPKEYDINKLYDLPKNNAETLLREFNNSSFIEMLPALRDAVANVRILCHEYGYRFTVITSLSANTASAIRRKHNLYSLFGPECFRDIICLDPSLSKHDTLSRYADSGCWWIEDKPKNAKVGKWLGLRPILVEQPHNSKSKVNYPKFSNWDDIAQTIIYSREPRYYYEPRS